MNTGSRGTLLDTTIPLSENLLAVHVNRFLIKTTEFLQNFSLVCETKLEGVSRRVHRIESSLAILEAKLGNHLLKSSLSHQSFTKVCFQTVYYYNFLLRKRNSEGVDFNGIPQHLSMPAQQYSRSRMVPLSW